MAKNQSTRLVWSDDPRENSKCARCGEFLKYCECRIEAAVNTTQITAVFRLETGGRGGKTVTVLDKLPKNEKFLESLCKEFKAKCGTGGTYKIQDSGLIEIQGDKREQMKAILTKKEIKFKGM